jgi:hypothetical protein
MSKEFWDVPPFTHVIIGLVDFCSSKPKRVLFLWIFGWSIPTWMMITWLLVHCPHRPHRPWLPWLMAMPEPLPESV